MPDRSKYFSIIVLLLVFFSTFSFLQAENNSIDNNHSQNDSTFIYYTVKPGDNLYKIAGKHLKYSRAFFLSEFVEIIKKQNNIGKNNIIHGGDLLQIPVTQNISKNKKHVFHNVMKGVYINPNRLNSLRLRNIIAQYDTLDFNTVVLDFKNIYGNILFPTRNQLAIQNGCYKPVISNPQKLIAYFHEHDISVHARIVMFKDTTMATAYPDWRPKLEPDTSQTGKNKEKSYKWCNPNSAEVQSYNLQIIEEVIKLGVDAIQLDYVRFPTESKLLRADYGIPDTVQRSQIITDFVKKVYELTQRYKVPLTADIFGIVAFQNKADVHNTGQDLTLLEPYLDRIHPMIYPSHFFGKFWNKAKPADQPYYFIYRTCMRLKQILQNPQKVVPYLEGFSLYSLNPSKLAIILQLQAVRDSGLESGFLFWNGYSRYKYTWMGAKEYFLHPGEFYNVNNLIKKTR